MIIADEATDSANEEQLSISVCFVEDGIPCEKFLGFHECRSGVTGEAKLMMGLAQWQGR